MQTGRTIVADEEAGKQDDDSSSGDSESADSPSGERSLDDIIDTYAR